MKNVFSFYFLVKLRSDERLLFTHCWHEKLLKSKILVKYGLKLNIQSTALKSLGKKFAFVKLILSVSSQVAIVVFKRFNRKQAHWEPLSAAFCTLHSEEWQSGTSEWHLTG